MSRTGSTTAAATASWTATPPFMSHVPRPYTRSSESTTWRELGRLPATGTVSRCPAITTRSARPRLVRATSASPSRMTSRCGNARSASSTRSASAFSLPLTDVEPVSGNAKALADLVEDALRALPHLEVIRDGDALVARTSLGRAERVVIAGHLDTVPVAGNLPTRVVGEGAAAEIWGRGAVDMKAGVAVQLALAAALDAPSRDVTWVFYDHEEVEAALSGLGRVARNHPDWLVGDFAVLCEPTDGGIEGSVA